MALPPLDTSEPLDPSGSDDPNAGPEDTGPDDNTSVDPMFAADMDDTGLDLDDKQMAAFQRAIMGLLANGGGGGLPPMGTPPAPGAPATPFG